MPAPGWFVEMLGWKTASKRAAPRCTRLFGEARGPNLADLSSTASAAIAGRAYNILRVPLSKHSELDLVEAGETPSTGSALERALEYDLRSHLQSLAGARDWVVTRVGSVSQFAQYNHLAELQRLFDELPTLRSTMGQDYQISTDIMVSLPNPIDRDQPRVLHAAVSSKFTIRSDRVQNIRYEFGMLVKNRKGRQPHLVVVTAEPLPSRLISIARGTGEIDAVYHLLFDEIDQVIDAGDLPGVSRDQHRSWHELVDQKRIRPYSELAAALAAG